MIWLSDNTKRGLAERCTPLAHMNSKFRNSGVKQFKTFAYACSV